MKAPSPLCLHSLRLLAFPCSREPTSYLQRRCYASLPDKPPPPPSSHGPPTLRNPAIQRPPPRPGSYLRSKRDDDEEFTPQPLSRPIGMPHPPQPGENSGLDQRTLRQKRDDFVDYDKHLAKRASMKQQIIKPYFRDWSNMRFHKGKVFVANELLFRGRHALFFPNFFGRILRKDSSVLERAGDGYGGLGRDTCEAMAGKVSVVSVVSNAWAQGQVETFCGSKEHPKLVEVLEGAKDVAQRVEINLEDNVLKWWVLRLFGLARLRRERSLEQQGRYFLVRRGVSDEMKEGIGLLNDKGGYVYLVDGEHKIRWAGSAIATETEKASMVAGLQRLISEARGEKTTKGQKPRLEEAVAEVVGA